MPDYSQGKIYKLVCKKTDKVYIGSTTSKYLNSRLCVHKCEFKTYKTNGTKYCSSFEVLDGDDFEILLIEDYPCNSKEELRQRERYFQEQIPCVNKSRAIISKEEHREMVRNNNKKEKFKEYLREYQLKNKEKIKEQRKKYKEKNKEKILETNRKWQQENKDKVHQYYLNQKNKRSL